MYFDICIIGGVMNFEINGLPPMCGAIAPYVGNHRKNAFNSGRGDRISKGVVKEMRRLWDEGMCAKEISQKFKLSRYSVYNVLKRGKA